MPSHPGEDPASWHPKCKNFEIFDWKKWEEKNVSIPFTYDPPQRYSYYQGWTSGFLFWWHRSCYLQPLGCMFHGSCCATKPQVGKLTDPSNKVLKELLRPNPDSTKVPKSLRNSLFWTQNNNAPETLLSFNRYAWRSQSETTGRVIGVGTLGEDFTSDATTIGAVFSYITATRNINVQQSPDGKWFLLTTFADPQNTQEECKFIFIYVVQEGDVFRTREGDLIEHVKPGDIMRLTWNTSDPWDTSELTYAYFPRRVAILDDNTEEFILNSPHYDALIEKATAEPGKCIETCCYCCMFCSSGPERWDFQVNHISNLQQYAQSRTPPSGEVIERF